jgi:PAS domain S-box-containing protein
MNGALEPSGSVEGGPAASEVERLERRIAELEQENGALRQEIAGRRPDAKEVLSILEALLAKAPVGFVFFDREFRYVLMNDLMAKIHGAPLYSRLGRPMREVSPVNARLVEPVLEQVFRTGEAVENLEIEGETLASPGERRHWLTGFYPVRLPDGSMPWVGGVVVEITEQKRTEEERRKLFAVLELERSRLASIFVQAPAFIATLRGPEHVFELANPQYDQLVGHREILGKPVREALPEIEGQGFFELLDQVYATGQPFVGNEVLVLLRREKGGPLERRYLNFVYQPLLDTDGSVSGIFAHGVDITEQVRTAEALREAGRKKDEFLAMLGHELRNPLAPIRNATEVIRLLGTTDPKLGWARDVIDRQVTQLTRMVDDLLDVSRVTRGRVELRREPTDLATVVAHAVETSRPLIDGRRHTLALALPPEPVLLHADPFRLSQVVANLLNNAAKYMDEGGRIWLSADCGEREVKIRVRDEGVGIPPEMLARVFDLFAQADRSLDRSQGGLGIGLALVRSLVALHGGSVAVFSEGTGRGSEFVVTLPTELGGGAALAN